MQAILGTTMDLKLQIIQLENKEKKSKRKNKRFLNCIKKITGNDEYNDEESDSSSSYSAKTVVFKHVISSNAIMVIRGHDLFVFALVGPYKFGAGIVM